MPFRRFTSVLVSLIICIGLSAASVKAQGDKPAEVKLYVGQITDNKDEYVALAISEGTATIYICDGQSDKNTVSILEWFIGPVKDNAIDITNAAGNRVQVKIADPGADSQFVFKDKTTKQASLELDPKAQLLRTEFTLDGTKYVAGWIILSDGTARGGLKNLGTETLTPSYINAYNSIISPR